MKEHGSDYGTTRPTEQKRSNNAFQVLLLSLKHARTDPTLFVTSHASTLFLLRNNSRLESGFELSQHKGHGPAEKTKRNTRLAATDLFQYKLKSRAY
jgi:hypothetical protein